MTNKMLEKWLKNQKVDSLEKQLAAKDLQLADKDLQLVELANELRAAKAKIPAVATPTRPVELVYTDKDGQEYFGFISEEAITTWRAEGIFRVANNQMLGVSDLDITQHEQAQNELLVKILASKELERATLMQEFFFNSSRLQERMANAGGYSTFKEIAKLVMILEGEPLEFANCGPHWDLEKERRMTKDPELIGFFLQRGAFLNETLKSLEMSGQLDSVLQTLSLFQD